MVPTIGAQELAKPVHCRNRARRVVIERFAYVVCCLVFLMNLQKKVQQEQNESEVVARMRTYLSARGNQVTLCLARALFIKTKTVPLSTLLKINKKTSKSTFRRT